MMTTPASTEAIPNKATHASETASAEAREQATEYDSVFGSTPLALEDGEVLMVPPHPDYGMLDDEAAEEWDELQFRMDTEYDREEDIFIPETRLLDKEGKETGVVLPPQTQRGALKTPYRVNGQLLKPPHTVKIVQVALGEEGYKKLRAGGRNAADVWRIWGERSVKVRERMQRDSKSDASAVGVASVSPTDSE